MVAGVFYKGQWLNQDDRNGDRSDWIQDIFFTLSQKDLLID